MRGLKAVAADVVELDVGDSILNPSCSDDVAPVGVEKLLLWLTIAPGGLSGDFKIEFGDSSGSNLILLWLLRMPLILSCLSFSLLHYSPCVHFCRFRWTRVLSLSPFSSVVNVKAGKRKREREREREREKERWNWWKWSQWRCDGDVVLVMVWWRGGCCWLLPDVGCLWWMKQLLQPAVASGVSERERERCCMYLTVFPCIRCQ